MHGKQSSARLHAAFKTLGLVFGNPKSHQRSDDAAGHADSARPGQHADDRAGGDQRPNARNGQSADARQPAQDAAHHGSRGSARCGAFGSFGVFLVNEILGARIFGQKDGDIGVPEAGGLQGFQAASLTLRCPDTLQTLLYYS